MQPHCEAATGPWGSTNCQSLLGAQTREVRCQLLLIAAGPTTAAAPVATTTAAAAALTSCQGCSGAKAGFQPRGNPAGWVLQVKRHRAAGYAARWWSVLCCICCVLWHLQVQLKHVVNAACTAANEDLHQQQHWRVAAGCQGDCEAAGGVLRGHQQALPVKHLHSSRCRPPDALRALTELVGSGYAYGCWSCGAVEHKSPPAVCGFVCSEHASWCCILLQFQSHEVAQSKFCLVAASSCNQWSLPASVKRLSKQGPLGAYQFNWQHVPSISVAG